MQKLVISTVRYYYDTFPRRMRANTKMLLYYNIMLSHIITVYIGAARNFVLVRGEGRAKALLGPMGTPLLVRHTRILSSENILYGISEISAITSITL